MSERIYKRLPGRGAAFGAMLYRLYQGPDHLLHVQSSRITERYKRFYYTDIQGFVVRRTASAFIGNILLLGLLALCVFAAYAMRQEEAILIVWAVIATFPLLLLAINLLLGPSCRTHLFTAASEEHLPSLNRVRRARKVLAKLHARITSAQGEISRDEISSALAAAAARAPTAPAPPGTAYSGLVHRILFTLVLVCGMLTVADIPIDSVALTATSSFVGMATIIAVILALIKGFQARVPRPLLAATWAAGVYVTLELITGYVLLIVGAIMKPALAQTQWSQIVAFSKISALEHPSLMITLAILAAIAFAVGGFGLTLSLRMPGRHPAPRL